MRIIKTGSDMFPEVSHSRKRIVAAHRPHRIGIRSCDKYSGRLFQWQDAVIFKQHHRLDRYFISRPAFLRLIENNAFCAI